LEGEIYMNKVILMGRLTRDPEVRYSDSGSAVARYTLAVDRKYNRDNDPSADFLRCVCFGKSAEFAEKYFCKGLKISITGRIQTGSYVNRDGQKVYTTDIVVDEQEFCESKATSNASSQTSHAPDDNGFLDIPDGIDDELPFN